MIHLSQICKRYPGAGDVLTDINLEIAAGEMVYLTGPSGAGKSTLLKLIAAIERPSSGSVVLAGQNLGRLRRKAIPYVRRNLGLIFQDHKLLFDRPTIDNVLLPLHLTGCDRRDARRRARAALAKVGLVGRERAMPVTLSGGEQQRVCIARAIVHRPTLILADEPTGNLDSGVAGEIMDMFHDFHLVGVTLLIASHDELSMRRHPARTLRIVHGTLR